MQPALFYEYCRLHGHFNSHASILSSQIGPVGGQPTVDPQTTMELSRLKMEAKTHDELIRGMTEEISILKIDNQQLREAECIWLLHV
jgi:hypothetical protein